MHVTFALYCVHPHCFILFLSVIECASVPVVHDAVANASGVQLGAVIMYTCKVIIITHYLHILVWGFRNKRRPLTDRIYLLVYSLR